MIDAIEGDEKMHAGQAKEIAIAEPIPHAAEKCRHDHRVRDTVIANEQRHKRGCNQQVVEPMVDRQKANQEKRNKADEFVVDAGKDPNEAGEPSCPNDRLSDERILEKWLHEMYHRNRASLRPLFRQRITALQAADDGERT